MTISVISGLCYVKAHYLKKAAVIWNPEVGSDWPSSELTIGNIFCKFPPSSGSLGAFSCFTQTWPVFLATSQKMTKLFYSVSGSTLVFVNQKKRTKE